MRHVPSPRRFRRRLHKAVIGVLAASPALALVVAAQPAAAATTWTISAAVGNGTSGNTGDGAAATASELTAPAAVVAGTRGLYVADSAAHVVRFVPKASGTYYGVAMTAGDIYTIIGDGTLGTSGVGGAATSAELGAPSALAVDASGDVFVADPTNAVVYVVPAASATLFGTAMTAGDLYVVAGTLGTSGTAASGSVATSTDLNQPSGVALDAHGNLLIADKLNNAVEMVAATTTAAYSVSAPVVGDLYTVAGTGTAGETGSGSAATSAELSGPVGLAVDASGNVAIADASGNVVHLLAASSATVFGQTVTAGDLYTVAGTGTAGTTGDGATATSAELSGPTGVAFDAAGDLYIADAGNDAIRYLAATTTAIPGTAAPVVGDLYTVAGTLGTAGATGRGGAPTSAELAGPKSVAIASAGSYYVADTGNSVVDVVNASQVASFTSVTQASFTVGTAASFTVQTSGGSPTPVLAETGTLPTGVTFTDNGDGTATLAGTPLLGSAKAYPLTLTATNSSGTATQALTLFVQGEADFSSATTLTCTVGQSCAQQIVAGGYPYPTITETGALPGGLTLVDEGNGTASISGTPTAGSGNQYPLTLSARNSFGTATQSIELDVQDVPAFTSGTAATCALGAHCSISITTTGYPSATITETGTVPAGMTFSAGANGTASLAGTPSGSAQTADLTFSATNAVGTAHQSFALTLVAAATPTTSAPTSVSFVGGPSIWVVRGHAEIPLECASACTVTVSLAHGSATLARQAVALPAGTPHTAAIALSAPALVQLRAAKGHVLAVGEWAAISGAEATRAAVLRLAPTLAVAAPTGRLPVVADRLVHESFTCSARCAGNLVLVSGKTLLASRHLVAGAGRHTFALLLTTAGKTFLAKGVHSAIVSLTVQGGARSARRVLLQG